MVVFEMNPRKEKPFYKVAYISFVSDSIQELNNSCKKTFQFF